MSNKNSFLVFGIKLVCAIIMTLASLFSFMVFGPRIEATYFPVVSKLFEVQYRQQGGDVILSAKLDKFRACEYIGVSWYKIDISGSKDQIRYINLRPPDGNSPTRPVGVQSVGPWLFRNTTIEKMQFNSYAELVHRCHPMWLTTTQFFP